jgi:hypothetical protein
MAEDQTEETYDTADWVDFFNLCQMDLTPYAKMLTTVSDIAVTVTSTKASIVLADDADLSTAHKILNVYYTPTDGSEILLRRLPPQDSYSKGWKMDSVNLYLQGLGEEETGTVKANIYKKLTLVVYEDDSGTYTPSSPEIPEEFHNMYVSYLCGKSQQREEEAEDENDFMAEYMAAKQTFILARIAAMEPWNLKSVVTKNA